MKCRAVMRVLDDYLEGLLAESERVEVEGHLGSCGQCRAEAEALRKAERALGMLAAVEQAPDLTADLRRRIEAAPSRRVRWVLVGVTAAAMVCVGAILVWGQARVKRGVPGRQAITVATAPATGRGGAGGGGQQQSAPAPLAGRPHRVAPTGPPAQAPTAGHPSAASANPSIQRKRSRRHGPERTVPAEAQTPVLAQRQEVAPKSPPELTPAVSQGLILILGEPEPIIPRSECHLEVALPDGTRSVTNQVVERNATGESRVIQIAYESP